MNIFSSFTRVFRWNWLKIGRYVLGYLLRKIGCRALFNFASVSVKNVIKNKIYIKKLHQCTFKVMKASFVEGNVRILVIKISKFRRV